MRSYLKRPLLSLLTMMIAFAFSAVVIRSSHQQQELSCDASLYRNTCNGVTCGVDTHQVFSANNTGCACTESDIGRRFTDCNGPSNTKSLFEFYRPPATCVGGVSLQAPIHDISCSNVCHKGQKFDVESKQCVTCPSGQYSYGPVVYYKDWNKQDGLPAQMRTECEMYYWSTGCNSWTVSENGYLESGDNKNYHSIKSILEYRVEVHEPIGTLELEYFVSSEAYFDYFTISVDNGNSILRESNTLPSVEWTPFVFNLTKGYHTIRFAYNKDASDSKGADMARIRSIRLSGVSDVTLKCDPCQPGTVSDGSHECTPCAVGTYQDLPEQSECKICPSGQSSFKGSITCYAMSIPCETSDYFSYYTACDANGRSILNYEWIQPQICNISHPDSVPLPERQIGVLCSELPQPKCNPGQEYNAEKYECQYCSSGKYSVDGEKCSSCESGSATEEKIITLEKFVTRDKAQFHQLITTQCSGECASNGWRFTEHFLDSGLGNGVSKSWLDIDVSKLKTKNLAIDYDLTCKTGGGSLDIEVDNYLALSIECSGCSNMTNMSRTSIELDEDIKTIRINYKTLSLLSNDAANCDRAVISKIQLTVEDATIGGASECDSCSEGEFTKDGASCGTCPAGTHSESESTTCDECQAGYFSYSGSSTCHKCGSGMTSEARSGKCEWEYGVCKYNGTLLGMNRLFDFGTLGRALWSASASSAANPDFAFYFDLCNEQVLGRTVRKIMDNGTHPCVASGSFVCMKDKAGEITSIGKSVSVESGLYGNENESGFHLHYTDYSGKNCYNNVTRESQHYEAILNMKCNPDASGSKYFGPAITLEKPCMYRMEFSSKYACPLCTNDDYTILEGTCDPKTLTKELVPVLKSDTAHRCYGGVQKSKETVSCSINVVTAPYWIVGGVLGGAGLAIIALAVAAVFFYLKFRDASQKFHMLQEGDNEDTGRAMQEM